MAYSLCRTHVTHYFPDCSLGELAVFIVTSILTKACPFQGELSEVSTQLCRCKQYTTLHTVPAPAILDCSKLSIFGHKIKGESYSSLDRRAGIEVQIVEWDYVSLKRLKIGYCHA